MKNSLAGTTRVPRGDCRCNLAPSARHTAGISAAGSASARLPPNVPRLRIATCATCGIASASSGAALRHIGGGEHLAVPRQRANTQRAA